MSKLFLTTIDYAESLESLPCLLISISISLTLKNDIPEEVAIFLKKHVASCAYSG
ncbi:MAG: hypothetical protein ACK4UN_03140 [Limisphaerales bacterium]